MYKYQITVFEHERGWGQDYWYEKFDTPEEAEARINEINSQNKPGPAPDYYIQASTDIRAVKEEAE
ncbi:hypothetical protein PP459_gp074 [Streptomyces phage Wakanda]|uniref:Uncharacterized protein n=1 Tax=Streptomyces phage Wakanda TaxID=2713267 RepID=A0A6G8R1T5_9CAUD|nr:hypothetical protein PP459_gp074 [Streptomyces phage Wakanda]QIN94159.1 hypothetical protein SEA_WAKANDA_198 [Streptomyces phage Wakanda]